MGIEFQILEGTKKRGIFTVKIEEGKYFSFNQSLLHNKDYFEEFEPSDVDIEIVNGIEIYHINGQIISFEEFKFVTNIIKEL